MRIYTDGASSPLKGGQKGHWGGWAWAVSAYEHGSGSECPTTNQRMEMTAVIRALQTYSDRTDLTIVSDSIYVVDFFRNKWHVKWARNGWKTRFDEPVKNKDLWQELLALTEYRPVEFEWVKGHSGDPLNELADKLAVKAKTTGRAAKEMADANE